MKIDFDGVQAFVGVAEHGGFGRAARMLNLTQTALTRRVQKLETYLGLRLLDRTTRRVELTAVGRDFLPQARLLVAEMTQAVDRLKLAAQTGRGELTLACIPSLTTHLLPALMRAYARALPDNRIRLLDGASAEVREAVLRGAAELGIGLRNEAHPELQQRLLLRDRLVVVCRAPHPLLQRTSVRWSDLRDAELIGVSSFTATRHAMDEQLAQRGIQVRNHYEVQHHATAINLVAAGVGVAVLPSSTVRDGDRQGLRAVPLTHPTVQREVVLLQRAGRSLSPAALAFQRLLAATDLRQAS